jgi:DNA-binding winged helix-turn-helix (wHTH) protein
VTDNALHRKLHAVRQILKDVTDRVYVETKYGVGFTLKVAQDDIKAAS